MRDRGTALESSVSSLYTRRISLPGLNADYPAQNTVMYQISDFGSKKIGTVGNEGNLSNSINMCKRGSK